MDIRTIGDCVHNDDDLGGYTKVLCVDGKCHVVIEVTSVVDGTSYWEIKPCDGTCHNPENRLPQPIMDDVIGFLKDGNSRLGRADCDILSSFD